MSIQNEDCFNGTRRAARSAGARYYYTGKPCIREHYSKRSVATGTCIACTAEDRSLPEAKERMRAYARAYIQTSRGAANIRRSQRKYRAKESYKEKARQLQAELRKNPEYRARLLEGARRNHVLKANPNGVPEWYDRDACVAFYLEAIRRTEATGERWVVDHIVPIARGGLHSAENLQVITWKANATKGLRVIKY